MFATGTGVAPIRQNSVLISRPAEALAESDIRQ